jgi:hypothetical protein
MSKLSPGRVALGVVGLGVGVVGISALREATLSTHTKTTEPSTELVVSARQHDTEEGQTLAEMVEAQLLTCRLEVTSDYRGPIEPIGHGRFRAVLVPALDETNRRQFRGCVEDFLIDGLQIDVLELRGGPE